MATIAAVTPVGDDDTNLGPVALTTGDQFLNTGREILYLKNTNAVTRTVTITSHASIQGLGLDNVGFTIAQNEEKLIGPFDPRLFNDGNGLVAITVTGAGVNVTVIKFR